MERIYKGTRHRWEFLELSIREECTAQNTLASLEAGVFILYTHYKRPDPRPSQQSPLRCQHYTLYRYNHYGITYYLLPLWYYLCYKKNSVVTSLVIVWSNDTQAINVQGGFFSRTVLLSRKCPKAVFPVFLITHRSFSVLRSGTHSILAIRRPRRYSEIPNSLWVQCCWTMNICCSNMLLPWTYTFHIGPVRILCFLSGTRTNSNTWYR